MKDIGIWAVVCTIWILLMIAFVSLLPSRSMASMSWMALLEMDKLGHMLFYALGAWLMNLSIHVYFKKSLVSSMLWAATIMSAYGITIEYIQEGMGYGRTFDGYDVAANCIGVLVGSIVMYGFKVIFSFIKADAS